MKKYEQIKVLIAEDLDSNYTFLSILLKKLGFRDIIWAKNGQEAVDLMNDEIGLVLMDLKMPVMDGYEAINLIREKYKEVPIVVQSAYILPDRPELMLRANCNGYIGKPIDIIKLRKLLENILN